MLKLKLQYFGHLIQGTDSFEKTLMLGKIEEVGLKLNIHGIWSHHFMVDRLGNNGNSDRLFWGAPKSLQMVTAAMKLKDTCSLEEKL